MHCQGPIEANILLLRSDAGRIWTSMHRQDALSRRKLGFDSPWERQINQALNLKVGPRKTVFGKLLGNA